MMIHYSNNLPGDVGDDAVRERSKLLECAGRKPNIVLSIRLSKEVDNGCCDGSPIIYDQYVKVHFLEKRLRYTRVILRECLQMGLL